MEPEAAVASASEATDDVENVDKTQEATTTKVEEKEKEPENAVQKHVIPEGLKKGNLHKQPSTQKSIDITSDCKVKIPEGKSPHFLFELDTKLRNFKFYADSEEERDSWIKALKECGVTFVPSQHEKEQSTSSKKPDDVSNRLEVPNSETNLEEEVSKAADAIVAASASETQEPTKKPEETKETAEKEATTSAS